MTTIVFALYDELSHARNVVQDLVDNGFARDNISLVVRDTAGRYAAHLQEQPSEATKHAIEEEMEGAVTGGLVGGLAGLLLGMGAFALPGIGPIIAAGPFAAMFVGAGAGSLTGSLVGAILKWDVPKKEAEYFVEKVRQGRVLVSAATSNERADQLITIMNRYQPVSEIKPYTTTEAMPSQAE